MFRFSIWNKTKFIIWCFLLIACKSSMAGDAPSSNSGSFSYQVNFCQTKTPINTIDEAVKCDYDSAHHPLNQGFGESPRWIRIRISTVALNNQLFAIQVKPYFLREINFFSYRDNRWTIEKAGSFITRDQSRSDIGGHFFITPPNSNNQNTYYLEVNATSIAHIFVSVTPWPSANLQASGNLLGIGAQIGILLTIFAFSLVSFFLNPTVVMARFNAFMANLIVCLLAGSGILALYVFKEMPRFNELILFFGLCFKLGLWVWLAQAFLREYKTPNWYKTSCWMIYGLVGMSIALGSIGKMDLSILLILIGYTITTVAQATATIKTPNIGRSFRTALIGGFSLSLALIYLALASVFFPLQNGSQVPLYLSRLTDYVNPLVMLSIIVFQNRLVREELANVKTALTETRLRSEFERQLLEDRRTLIDMLAHELKNPLTSISLAIDNLSSDSKPGESAKKRIANINRSIRDMDEIIERCNLMNNLEAKEIALEKNTVQLYDFIHQIVNNLGASKRVSMGNLEHISFSTDAKFLKVIFTNLIQNALKYSQPNSTIKIAATKKADFTTVSFQNEISPAMIPDEPSIFERFYRHPLAQEHRGAGLGLYLTKELCKLLSGRISYNYQNGVVSFSVEIPNQL